MNLDRVGPGKDIPNDFNVIIEIPAHSDPVKYEVDKNSGAMFVDRFMSTAMHYPCNYGYIPHTLSADGDPVDVLVATPYPLISGSVVRCRPVGVLKMTDESGDDAKVLAVPVSKLCSSYAKVQGPDDQNVTESDRPLLRALQGSGRRQVGPRSGLGRRGSRQGRNTLQCCHVQRGT